MRAGIVAQLVRGSSLGDQVADVIVHHQQFEQAVPALEAEVVAFVAAFAVVELLALHDPRASDSVPSAGRGWGRRRLRQFAQILRVSRWARIPSTVAVIMIRLDTHVAQSSDGARCIVGVQG